MKKGDVAHVNDWQNIDESDGETTWYQSDSEEEMMAACKVDTLTPAQKEEAQVPYGMRALRVPGKPGKGSTKWKYVAEQMYRQMWMKSFAGWCEKHVPAGATPGSPGHVTTAEEEAEFHRRIMDPNYQPDFRGPSEIVSYYWLSQFEISQVTPDDHHVRTILAASWLRTNV